MAPLRTLVADGWVVGIASAIAVGYAVVVFVRSVAALGLNAIAGEDASGPLTAYGVSYRGVVSSGITLVAVVALAALAMHLAEQAQE